MENKVLREWNRAQCPEKYAKCEVCNIPVNKAFALFTLVRVRVFVWRFFFCDDWCYMQFMKEKKNE